MFRFWTTDNRPTEEANRGNLRPGWEFFIYPDSMDIYVWEGEQQGGWVELHRGTVDYTNAVDMYREWLVGAPTPRKREPAPDHYGDF